MLFKGWGTSLAWWANINYPNSTKNKLAELLFSDSGLGLNIVRYNLGGGTDPSQPESTMRTGGLMPCIKNGPDEEITLTNDHLQLSILDDAVKLGVNHVELFVNSPPWWMTHNGKTSGSDRFATNNLKDDKTIDYINFLIESYNILKKKYPVKSLAPFNEPSNPLWMSGGSQEGCFFNYNSINKIIQAIKSKDSNIPIAAADSFSIGFMLPFYMYSYMYSYIYSYSYKDPIDQINLHSYKLSVKGYSLYLDDLNIFRNFFKNHIKKHNKRLWVSEFGMGGPDTIENAFKLALHIFRDLQTLNPEAWVYWQVVENQSPNGWGLLHVNFTNPKEVTILKQYWIMMHFTKTLKENDTYKFLNKNVIQVKNRNSKCAYIIIGEYDLNYFTQFHLQNIRITDKDRNYQEIDDLPMTLNDNSIITFILQTEVTFMRNRPHINYLHI